MPIYRLTDRIVFPDPNQAESDGLLAIGGDLRPERLLLAYRHGIFPWPHTGYPLLWFSPDPRMVLRPGDLHVSRRLERTIRSARFEVRFDTAFEQVITACARIRRRHERGTWITPAIIQAYRQLHALGAAHSAEAWQAGELVGGLYGIAVGGAFIGESMFARVPDASKVALVTLVRQLDAWGFTLFDAQIHSEHIARFGATEWPRADYLRALAAAVASPVSWRLGVGEGKPAAAAAAATAWSTSE